MKSNYKQLGEYIEIVSRVNSDLKYGIDDVRGCSNTKKMMQTRANLIGRTYEKFIVLKPQEFVFNRRTTRNGEKIGMAYNDTDREYIFTNDYVAFRVKKECLSILLLSTCTYSFVEMNLIDMRDTNPLAVQQNSLIGKICVLFL